VPVPAGVTQVSDVAEATVTFVAAVAPNVTAVVPCAKWVLEPVIVIVVPPVPGPVAGFSVIEGCPAEAVRQKNKTRTGPIACFEIMF
jgi:hypothetical protein